MQQQQYSDAIILLIIQHTGTYKCTGNSCTHARNVRQQEVNHTAYISYGAEKKYQVLNFLWANSWIEVYVCLLLLLLAPLCIPPPLFYQVRRITHRGGGGFRTREKSRKDSAAPYRNKQRATSSRSLVRYEVRARDDEWIDRCKKHPAYQMVYDTLLYSMAVSTTCAIYIFRRVSASCGQCNTLAIRARAASRFVTPTTSGRARKRRRMMPLPHRQ